MPLPFRSKTKRRSAPRSSAPVPDGIVQGWEGSAIASVALFLLAVGLTTVYSASAYEALHSGLRDWTFLVKQVEGVGMGLVILAVVSQIDYHRWDRAAWPMLLVVMLMLLILVIPGTYAIAPRVNGGRRWLDLRVLTIQPSEFAKFALVIWTARTLVRKADRMHSLHKGMLPFLLVWAMVMALIALEPSMSAALLCALLVGVIAFAGRARLGHFIALGVVGAPLLWLAIAAESYRMRRISSFMRPGDDVQGASYQVNQALTALGSGGWLGRGLGQSKMKLGFLPYAHNDFASSVLGEEWGFVGLATLILLYALIGLIGYRIARRASDMFGALLAVGATALLVLPAFIHIAINLRVLPATGVALPFISSGRSSLFVAFAALGLLLNIAAAASQDQEIRRRRSGR